MADVIYPVTGRSISLRYKDMGDGTFAEVVSVIGASGSGADASAANQLTEIARLEAIRDRLPSFSLPAYDHMTLGYTGSDLTSVTYRSGGAGGTVVATLTLGYSGGNLVTIARS